MVFLFSEVEKMSDMTSKLSSIIETTFSQYGYPEAFLSEYDQMECLASRAGRETFLCRKKDSGDMAVAKCFENAVYEPNAQESAIRNIDHPRIPHFVKEYRNEQYTCILREYVSGETLSEIARERELGQEEIIGICEQLADILIFLHGLNPPIIHRDVKPENVIIDSDGKVYLIDLDIARIYKEGADSDTVFYGTRGYAPPEQYGFAQTDARADIYSFGVLLRFLLTGSIRENKNIRVYEPLQRIINKCTVFSPEKRYADMKTVKKDLMSANPKAQLFRRIRLGLVAAVICAAALFAGLKAYQKATYNPFTSDHVPAYQSDEEKIRQAVEYMREHFDTDLFDDMDGQATAGFLREVFIDVYGLDPDYARGINTDIPRESEEFFLPWGWDDAQTMDRDVVIYAAIKLYDPAIVVDWSSLSDDNGYYPGVRVALAYAEKHGIGQDVNRPGDVTKGEAASILADADRVFGGRQES